MIIAHVLLDTPTLEACFATCGSWYPALYPTSTTLSSLTGKKSDSAREGFVPLRNLKLGEMQLLPLIRRLQIMWQSHDDPWFPPTITNVQTSVYFSALKNVQELGFDEVDLSALTPQAQQYFEHFAPTLRSLTLRKPRGTHSQFLCFTTSSSSVVMGTSCSQIRRLFRDQRLRSTRTVDPGTAAWRGFLRGLSEMCGSLRFRHMDLFGVEGAPRSFSTTCSPQLQTLVIPWKPSQHLGGPIPWFGRFFGLRQRYPGVRQNIAVPAL